MKLELRQEGADPQPLEPSTCSSCGQVFYGYINLTHEILCPLIQKGQMDKLTKPILFTHMKVISPPSMMQMRQRIKAREEVQA